MGTSFMQVAYGWILIVKRTTSQIYLSASTNFGEHSQTSRFSKAYSATKRRKLGSQGSSWKQEKITELNARLNQIRHEEQTHQRQYADIIETCIKYWPDYPPEPFWSRLQELKHSRQRGKCKDCERRLGNWSGHLHHKKPLSMGGTNDSRNLVLLCGRCHQKRHSHLFSGVGKIKVGSLRDYQSLTINERLRLSLSEGKKIFIKCQDMSGVRTERWVKIKEFIYESRNGSRIWIKSHCYLREDERSFRVDRIQSASDRRRS